MLTGKLNDLVCGLVVDVPCHRGSTAHDLLVCAADKLNRNTIDPVWLYKNKSSTVGSAINPDLISDVPIKALATLLSSSSKEILFSLSTSPLVCDLDFLTSDTYSYPHRESLLLNHE